MHTIFVLAIVSMPPRFGIPSLFDAWQGWLLGILIFLLPSAILAYRSHFVLGHWMRFLGQWRHRVWWFVVVGSAIAAIGAIGEFGAIPVWVAHYHQWESTALQDAALNSSNASPILWLRLTEQPMQTLLNGLSIAFLAAGILLLVFGSIQFNRQILIKRKAVAPNPEWVMISPSE